MCATTMAFWSRFAPRWGRSGARAFLGARASRPLFRPSGKEVRAGRPRSLLRRPRGARPEVRYVVRIDPGGVGPAVLVVVRHAGIGERDHLVEGAGAARVPHRLDADVLVVAGVVHLVELVAAAELGADRVP